MFAGNGLAGHVGGRDVLAVIVDEIPCQRIEMAVVIGKQTLRDGVAHAVGIVLVKETPLRQESDGLPVSHLERAARGARESMGIRSLGSLAARQGRVLGFDKLLDRGGQVRAGKRVQELL